MVGPKAKRRALEASVLRVPGLSRRQGCQVLGLHHSTLYYRGKSIRDDSELRAKLRELAALKPNWGYRSMIWKLQRSGLKDNHKRIRRIYRDEALQIGRRKRGKRKVSRKLVLETPTRPNELWAMDFVQDSLASGRRFRILTVKDLFTHEALVLYVDHSIPGERVAEVLNDLIREGRRPKAIVCDNGSEFTSKAMDQWASANNVELKFIQPGRPIQNAFIESFNGKLRSELLNAQWFESLEDAQERIELWRVEYNTDRPNTPLGKETPAEFAKRHRELLIPVALNSEVLTASI